MFESEKTVKMGTPRYKIVCEKFMPNTADAKLADLGMGRFRLEVFKIWVDLGQPGESR